MREPGCEFQQTWTSGKVPEMIAVFIQHTTPFYDDSYVLNSANNGPCGDALTTELVPEIDRRFRTIGAPNARILTGGSMSSCRVASREGGLARAARHPSNMK